MQRVKHLAEEFPTAEVEFFILKLEAPGQTAAGGGHYAVLLTTAGADLPWKLRHCLAFTPPIMLQASPGLVLSKQPADAVHDM